ncbi:MAG TPA: hypothetical protein VLB51_07325 [Methylomirabilota bacterium]|nr:hypothetical protein [Methylomirabilota bacterium]
MSHRSADFLQRLLRPLALLIASTLATSACAGDQAGPAPGEPVQAIPAQPPAATPPAVAAVIPDAAIERLRGEAARAAGVPLDSVRVLESEAVTWPDSGLGCSGPDESTLQVLTPGYRVVLEAGGRRLEYRGDSRGHFSLCPEGRGGPPAEWGGAAVDR